MPSVRPRASRRSIVLSVALLALTITAATAGAAQGDNPDMKPVYHFVRLLGTRAGWPDNMTEREQQVMTDHFAYLQNLTRTRKVVAAGPVMDPTFGLIILRTASETEAREIMAAEPSVAAGVHTYEMQPMVLSLLNHHTSPLRYVSPPAPRTVRKEITVPAPLDTVWNLWTTSEGMQSFLVERANIDLRIGGPYELYFSMEAPPGLRGSEDCTILSYLPKRLLSIEWNAPPSFPTRRDAERTWVVLEFEPASAIPFGRGEETPHAGPEQTRVTLTHLGWGEGDDWDAVYTYFDRAWESVLSAMLRHLTNDAE